MLTKRQKQVLDFIKSFQKKKGYSPSLEEIKRHLRLSSVSTVHHHVQSLEDQGYLRKGENQPRTIDVYKTEQMIKIPLYGTIAAGQPIEAIQEKENIAVPKTKLPKVGDFYALKVAGDSMIDENIDDGDIVIVKNQPTADNGQRVVALIDNYEVTLKKLYREKNKIRLQPANPTIDPIFVKPSRLIIQGVVIDIIKSLQESSEQTTRKTQDIEEERQLPKKTYKLPINKIICGDCIEGLKTVPTDTIDGCITDPPYNYEFIGHKWNADEIKRRTSRIQNSSTLVKHIPYGSGLAGGVRNRRWYQRNAENIKEYREWTTKWGKEVYRVLKPGGYIAVFNSTRTIAQVQVALEDVGFYARDIIVWRKNSGIPKGLNFAKKLKKEGIKGAEKWAGWHSCLRNEWEAIALLQKPLTDNYLKTVKKYGVGLLHTTIPNGGFQPNIIDGIKNGKKENFNVHCTVKPVQLILKLISLTIPPDHNNIVLDPFMGSGTTAIAALEKGIKYLGFEINNEYREIAEKRIKKYREERKQRLF